MVFMKRFAYASICILLLAAGCGPSTQDNSTSKCQGWPLFRANLQNTGTDNSHCSPNEPQLDLKWRFAASGAVIQTPVTFEGKVYAGSVGQKMHCVNQEDGKEVWLHDAGDEITTPAAFAKDKIIFGTKHPLLVCLDSQTGQELWIIDAEGQLSIPTVDNGFAYFSIGSPRNEIVKANLEDGKIVWATKLDTWSRGCPAFLGNKLVIGCNDGTIRMIDSDTGTQVATFKTTAAVTTSVAIYDEKLFFSTYDGKIHCYDPKSNFEVWVENIGISQESSVSVWRENVYFGANNGYFYCLDARNGITKWVFDTGVMRRIIGSSAVSKGMVWFTSENNYLYCLDAFSGEKLWSYKTGDRIWSSPVISSKNIILGCNDANVYCFGE